jgi:nucleotide-binding universal stress UspA family protein
MDKITTILVPYDFSETSKNALNYTVNFIGHDKSIKILLTHVSSDSNEERELKAFNDLKKQYSGTLKSPMEWISKSGSLTESILELQKSREIDLVIMGTSGVGDKTDAAVTNTAKLVVEADNCPVLVIPAGVKTFAIEKIALVLGKNKIDDRSALETMLCITRRFNAKVIVLTIQNEEGLYGYSEADESNENLLEYYLENFYSHHTFIENPDIVQGIADYASTHSIDMVAILPRNHAQQSTPSEGRLTKELTMHSKVPILAID